MMRCRLRLRDSPCVTPYLYQYGTGPTDNSGLYTPLPPTPILRERGGRIAHTKMLRSQGTEMGPVQ